MSDLRQLAAHQEALHLILGTLLTGGGQMFGKPVALAWPEGMPPGVTEDFLRNLGEQMLRDSAGPSTWVEAASETETCRVYWGHSGCGLPRGHDADQPIRTHRQFTPADHEVTPRTAFLFGEDLTEAEQAARAEEWG